jgi:enoyl-CoA hydratase/carnithine racemase
MSIDVTVNEHVMAITINRPDAMNALDIEHNDELGKVWRRFVADANARVAILTGAGDKSFCAGADLKSLIPAQRQAIAHNDRTPWAFGGGLARGMHVPKPVIAAVNGHCLAGGLEMALACDIRLCSPNAHFGLAEVKWAIIPGAGGTQRLPRAVPLGMALEMILSGDPIDAEEAFRIGLVNHVVKAPDLLKEVYAYAERLLDNAPFAMGMGKHIVHLCMNTDMHTGRYLERLGQSVLVLSEDHKEGMQAFFDKRKPKFKGR